VDDELTLKRSPLEHEHLTLGAKLGPFAGWNMPIEYEGALAEHRAVRDGVGLFDLTHLGKVEVAGPGALGLLQGVVTNDVEAVEVGEAQYNLVLNEGGGLIEDLIVYRLGLNRYFVVPNASNTNRVLQILAEAEAPGLVHLMYHQDWSFMAVQGPDSPAIVEALFPEARGLAFMRCTEASFRRRPVILTRSGYTGEVGYELFTYEDVAVELWRTLLDDWRWATRCTARICSSPRPPSRRDCHGRYRWTRGRSAATMRSFGSVTRACRVGCEVCGCVSDGTSRERTTRCSGATC
jgi:aminomethyltransferase